MQGKDYGCTVQFLGIRCEQLFLFPAAHYGSPADFSKFAGGTRIFQKFGSKMAGGTAQASPVHQGQVLDSQQLRIREGTGAGALKACERIQLLKSPQMWNAQPVPWRMLGLSVVFATVLSFLSRLWSALEFFCCKRTGLENIDTAMISAGTMPSVPRTSSPLFDSSNGTLTHKYTVGMRIFFKRASSAGPPQSERSQSKRDTRANSSSTLQYPKSCFEASVHAFTRAVSAGPPPSTNTSGELRKQHKI